MEGTKDRQSSLESFSSVTVGGRAASVGGRTESMGTLDTTSGYLGRPYRRLSMSSSLTNKTRKSSKIEVVDMPGGRVLLEVDEIQDDLVSLVGGGGSHRDSLSGVKSVGGVVVAPDTQHFDRKIKKEMAHHSPAVGTERRKKKEPEAAMDTSSKTQREEDDEEDPPLVFGANNLLQHLFLALASPAVFRLPALCYKWSTPEGSGFFTVYTILLVVMALPLCVLEQTLAQFSSLGASTIFRCLPLLTGVGVGMVVSCSVLMLYSSTVLAWSVRYVFDCLKEGELPWTHCPDNVELNATAAVCWEVGMESVAAAANEGNVTTQALQVYIPSDYYFLNTILGVLDAEEENGAVISLSLGVTQGFLWLFLLLLAWWGESWRAGIISKMWSLVTTLIILSLMINGLALKNAGTGLGLIFSWYGGDLSRPDIWLDAFGQVVWTLGPTLGILITRTSYNRFRQRIRLDVYTAVAANLILALVLCLAVFPFQGHLSTTYIDKTPGYFFVISSLAVTNLPAPQFGGVALYLGVCKALLDHTQMLVSTVAVGISELLPVPWRSGGKLFICKGSVCLLGFFASLPFVTNEGIFLMQAVDSYMAWVCGLSLGTLEVGGLLYIYGASNVARHFKIMLKKDATVFLITWKFILLPSFLVLGVWACVGGVVGPVEWVHVHLSSAREDMYTVTGVVVALLPGVVCLVVTVGLVSLHFVSSSRSVRSLLLPRETWGPALQQHRALYSTGLLRAKDRSPYLIVVVETEGSEEVQRKGWLPYGYYWFPSKTMALYLMNTISPADTLTRAKIARYLQLQFSSEGDYDWLSVDDIDSRNDVDSRNDEDLPPRITVLNPEGGTATDRQRRHGVPWGSGNPPPPPPPAEDVRTVSTSTLSSGVLLRPNSLAGAERQQLGQTSSDSESQTNVSSANFCYDNYSYEK